MTLYKDKKWRRKLIMSRYKNPIHGGELDVEPLQRYSDQCVDQITLYIEWNGDVVKSAKHTSKGCAVFMASTDLFIDYIIGKTRESIKIFIKNYENMINQNLPYDADSLGELIIFDNVKTHLNRLTCANMISELLKTQ